MTSEQRLKRSSNDVENFEEEGQLSGPLFVHFGQSAYV